MENPPTISLPEGATATDIENAEMERTIKIKMAGDKIFRNLIKFLRLTMEAACNNLQLLTSK